MKKVFLSALSIALFGMVFFLGTTIFPVYRAIALVVQKDVEQLTQESDSGIVDKTCPEPIEGIQSPLYEHRIEWAHSEDGVHFQSDGHVLLEHASVPDGVLRDDGEIWVYYVNGVPGQHAIFVARLEGEELVPLECIRLDGEVVGDAVDPDIVSLPEGGYRLFYFLGWFTPENRPPPGGAPHPMYSAVSADGVHFEVEQVQLTLEKEGTDPTVVCLPSGRWLMAVTVKERVVLAATDTGDDFALTDHEFPSGISELAYFPEAQVVRLFISGLERTVWESADEGETWEEIPMVKIPGPDPSVVPDGEGGWIMFYKTFASENLPPPGKPKMSRLNGSSDENGPSAGLASELTSSYRVDIYDPARAWNGTTLTVDISDPTHPRFVEIDEAGNIIYEYAPDIDEAIGSDIEPGPEEGQFMMLLKDRIRILDVKKEALGDGTAIQDITLPGRPSHDVDIDHQRGTFLVNYGNNDPDPWESNDLYHVLELDKNGNEVWRWNAYEAGITEDVFTRYNTSGGYYHCNAVHRYYENGEMRTMISIRNFNLFVVVDGRGTILEVYDCTRTSTGKPKWFEVANQVDPHDPHLLSDGQWLVCLQRTGAFDVAVVTESVTESGTVEIGFTFPGITIVRDADPLPNGNTLCQALVKRNGIDYSTLFEFDPEGTIVWQVINEKPVKKGPGYFYKVHRCPEGKGPSAYRTAALI